VATWSIAASAVTVVPSWNIAATNVQTALEELDAEKVATSTTITINWVTYDLSTDRSWTVSASADPWVMAIAMINS
jgi:hypothetical protein